MNRVAALLASASFLTVPFAVASAQESPPPSVSEDSALLLTAQTETVIKSITVAGNQRLEADTVLSYLRLQAGESYDRQRLDQALKDLADTQLFSDFEIRDDSGILTIQVTENPVVNRVILEGNRRLKDDKIRPEIKLSPRQIFTRSRVRADVARIIELYKRQGRYAARVEPKMVMLEQNRVDVVFEITEGPKSKVRRINIIGNIKFKDKTLKGEMATKEAIRITSFLSSNTSYDPDRLTYDQQKLRLFYLQNGYADFRVLSAVAEQTSNERDFIITYNVEEGERYRFGKVDVESEIRGLNADVIRRLLPMKSGDWYDAKKVEDTVESLSDAVGLFGYAFAGVIPRFRRDPDTQEMEITFTVSQSPRTYVERIEISGNTITRDKVIRREFRLAEGDSFNSFGVKRSESRIKSLGFFQENFEIERQEGNALDRIILKANVEERPTGELSFSAGFSSIENFLLQASVRQRNFRGLGQQLSATANYSRYSRSIEFGFTEPALFDSNLSLGGRIYRRDLNSFNFFNNTRRTTFSQATTGGAITLGIPLTEYWSIIGRYSLDVDRVTLDENLYFFAGECDPLRAGRYLCEALGRRVTSLVGVTFSYDNRDNRYRPTRGHSLSVTQDLAGLGGSVRYLRTRLNATKHYRLGKSRFILNFLLQGGYIIPLSPRTSPLRLTDRFFLGQPQLRGFDIRGVGPRVIRYTNVDVSDPTDPVIDFDERRRVDDALGGRAYYLGRAELEIPLGGSARELGFRPSLFVDAGAVFQVRRPTLTTLAGNFTELEDPDTAASDTNRMVIKSLCRNTTNGASIFATQANMQGPYNQCPQGTLALSPFEERFLGNSASPRLSIGVGFDWNSPIGPFRIDFAYALLSQPGDDIKRFSFNVGTQF